MSGDKTLIEIVKSECSSISLYSGRIAFKSNKYLSMIDLIRTFVIDNAMPNRGYSKKDCFWCRMAINELITNAAEHGNKFDLETGENADKYITVRWDIGAEKTTITITDQGDGFALLDPEEYIREYIEAHIEASKIKDIHMLDPGGRGVYLVLRTADSAKTVYSNENCPEGSGFTVTVEYESNSPVRNKKAS